MPSLYCTTCPQEEQITTLPQTVAESIENLRDARIRSLAEMPEAGTIAPLSDLERHVDVLLDSLHTLHRLEQLASYVARGGNLTVDADRLLVAENPQAFKSLLEQYSAEVAAATSLLPSYPRVVDL